ncbi:cupin domain-containing protein [Streptomyces sp. DSM 44915]|uniref:Cupin domain-containing protein n=1 Tax=Streptomyces chisholmiae TaxID=3075540 RepID=A0ABU2JNC8_9ACTN|nr:cupin domain-containing protein [Streptomyces sp. DSM 44915]MDT0266495.1 cupin domain-containing protein [Streptomyces sp. DSM 44915]
MTVDERPTDHASVGNPMTAEDSPELRRLYADFDAEHLIPLWTQLGELMPMSPAPRARPHVWRWGTLHPLAARAGELVPVGRGGERRAIALANPGLAGHAYATPTLWAAIQYLGPRETAPEHRHAQNAFRFVVEGEGVWTVVDGDPVRMSRGDLLLTPGWQFHGHHNETDRPMAWLDGLDIPFSHYTDVGFFEFGSDRVTDYATPRHSRAERLWCHPGLRPLTGLADTVASPIAAYRWEHTDRALTEQLLLEEEGHPATVGQGHAAIRYVNPTTGGDVLPTIRTEFHRLRLGAETATRREVGSSVFQVFQGRGRVVLDGVEHTVEQGDLFVVPSWVPWSVGAESGTEGGSTLDLFRFSDAPVMERLGFARTHVEGENR